MKIFERWSAATKGGRPKSKAKCDILAAGDKDRWCAYCSGKSKNAKGCKGPKLGDKRTHIIEVEVDEIAVRLTNKKQRAM